MFWVKLCVLQLYCFLLSVYFIFMKYELLLEEKVGCGGEFDYIQYLVWIQNGVREGLVYEEKGVCDEGDLGFGRKDCSNRWGLEYRDIVGLINVCGINFVGDGNLWRYEWGCYIMKFVFQKESVSTSVDNEFIGGVNGDRKKVMVGIYLREDEVLGKEISGQIFKIFLVQGQQGWIFSESRSGELRIILVKIMRRSFFIFFGRG